MIVFKVTMNVLPEKHLEIMQTRFEKKENQKRIEKLKILYK